MLNSKKANAMQKIQESKIKMSRAVSGILTAYVEFELKTPGLKAAHEALDNLIRETERHTKDQGNNGTDITKMKDNSRLLLENSIIHIGSSVVATATASDVPLLKRLKLKYQVTDSEIRKMRDMQLFTYSYTLYDDANPLASQLEPFASADEVMQLKENADNFNALLPQRRTQVSKSSLATANLEEAITQIDNLLIDTIDVLVKPWENKEPDFFKAYKNARLIVDAASRKTKDNDDETPESK
jgi:hypothetical protein